MMLGLTEPATTAALLVVLGALMAVSAFGGRLAERAGVPTVLLFLVLGMVGGSEGLGGIAFDNAQLAFRLGTIALILILLDGGLNISWRSVRRAAAPAGLLATVGVGLTALLVTLAGRGLGLGWEEAALIGVVVSSTDAAAVFAVLRGGGIRLDDKVRSTIEVESCVNDPMAVILTTATIAAVQSGSTPHWLALLGGIAAQLVIGAVCGGAVGLLLILVMRRVHLHVAGLYPVVLLGAAFGSFGVATLVGGSGFLAVFVTAAMLGNGPLPYKSGIRRVQDAVAWLSQVGMFLMLGLLVFPSRLFPVAGIGLALGLFLAVVARPLAVWLCLAALRVPGREIALVGWVGLRGAAPIVLATFPIMADVPNADRVFHIVFFIVVVSSLVPGASIAPVTRRLKLGERRKTKPVAALELHSLQDIDGELRLYVIEPEVAAAGATLRELPFPEGAAIVLVVRGQQALAARGHTRLEPGDHVYVVCKREDEALVGLYLGRSAER
ncbi:MAG: potassium/proton antiporter [Phycisphaerales bacterium]